MKRGALGVRRGGDLKVSPALRLAPLLFLVPPVVIGCSSESSQPASSASPAPVATAPPAGNAGANHPPAIRAVKLMPEPIVPGEPVQAQVDAEDEDGDSVLLRHQWFANGEPIPGAVASTLSPTMLKRGDQLTVEVVPLDGKVQGPPVRSSPVTMPNSPPEATRLTLGPGQPHIGDRVDVDVEGKDQDDDTITYSYRWFRNNAPVEGGRGDQPGLDTTGFARGDVILVDVTPQDGIEKGRTVRSPPLTIVNNQPAITSTPPSALKEGRFEYAVTAVDQEGDPLTYGLEAAPSGMTIDKATGRILWQVPPGTKGTQRVRVVVRDNHEGQGFQEFELDMG